MNIAQLLSESAHHYRDKPLLRFRGQDVEYDAFVKDVDALTGALFERGIGPKSRVLLVAKNSPAWLTTAFAALRTGALTVPVNPALTSSEIGYIIGHAMPDLIVLDENLSPVLPSTPHAFEVLEIADGNEGTLRAAMRAATRSQHIAQTDDRSPGLMFYTSGTTGRPKGAVLGHGAEIFTAELIANHFRIGPDDVSLIASSLSFIYPLVIDCLSSIKAGATVVLLERFSPELVLRAIEAERATIFMGVPTMYTMMLGWAQRETVDASTLRFAVSAGQNLPWSIVQRFRERFGVPVYDLWGQTEGTPITGYDPAMASEGRPDSCGRALPGCAVRVIDDEGRDVQPDGIGEVLLAGPNVFLGYYDDPAATAETLRDGWVYTGDLGRLDAEGYLYIVGRKRDMIIRGGANIYPSELEEVIYAHSSVQDCAVIGVPDAIYGERVKAFVVLVSGHAANADAILAHCRNHLAPYKIPNEISFLAALPVGATGKILKRVLRERDTCR